MANVLLDTNMWLRIADPTAATHGVAAASVKSLSGAAHTTCTCVQVLIEFWVVATRPCSVNGLEWTTPRTDAFVQHILERCHLLEDKESIFPIWRTLVQTHDIKGKRSHDARIAAVMAAHGVLHLLTFNGADFAAFPQVKVLAPADVANGTAIVSSSD